jgi:hypothetical protein
MKVAFTVVLLTLSLVAPAVGHVMTFNGARRITSRVAKSVVEDLPAAEHATFDIGLCRRFYKTDSTKHAHIVECAVTIHLHRLDLDCRRTLQLRFVGSSGRVASHWLAEPVCKPA